MSLATPQQIRTLLLDGRNPRFLQESPILHDVWAAFARDPDMAQDLLLTVHATARASVIAADLRETLKTWREKRKPRQVEAASVAALAGVVAARVYLDELFGVILPMTAWWNALQCDLTEIGTPQIVAAVSKTRQRARLSAADTERFGDIRYADLAWMVSCAGALLAALAEPATPWPPPPEDSVRAFDRTVPKSAAPRPAERTIWRVARNRDAHSATTQSVLTIKGDAALALFNISCAHLTWAILDCGIDRTHPAFMEAGTSRIVRTYDFTRVRDLLDPAHLQTLIDAVAQVSLPGVSTDIDAVKLKDRIAAYMARQAPDGATPSANEIARFMIGIRRRLESALEVDMGMLEPFIELHDPDPPSLGHGTHVAGILGGKWFDNDTPKVVGVCPDIRMIDLRVLPADDPDGLGTEFAVIAALQYIRYVNANSNQRVIHGANLSLCTPNDVRNDACGATPVCEACNALAASGVVVVVAAGNEGHRVEELSDGRELVGYFAISITDPGNAEGVITVGSAHKEKPHQYGVSYFSSRGPTGDGRVKPDLVAPGERVSSTLPGAGIGPRDGTSQAAPHVSGAAALLMGRYPELVGRPARIKEVLCATATDLGRDRYFQGAGLVDILRALQSI